jgi:hypothetical protein
MFVADRVKVVKLERHAPGDRSELVDRDGELIQRLNVAWEPATGALWRVRFDGGREEVFSESELAVIDAGGREEPSEIPELKAIWGVAPRSASAPYRRGSLPSRAVLAFLLLSTAGALLIWAGAAQHDLRISGAGAVLVLIGIAAAAALVA